MKEFWTPLPPIECLITPYLSQIFLASISTDICECETNSSVLELAIPVWHSSLALGNKISIETVKKEAMQNIVGPSYILG